MQYIDKIFLFLFSAGQLSLLSDDPETLVQVDLIIVYPSVYRTI